MAHETRHHPDLAPSDLLASLVPDISLKQQRFINADIQQAAAGSTFTGTSAHGQVAAPAVAISSFRMESQGPVQQRQQGSELLNALLTIDIG